MELGRITKSLGVLMLVAGFLVCIFGFNNSITAPWQSSIVYNRFAEMLLGISLLLTANGIIKIGKNT